MTKVLVCPGFGAGWSTWSQKPKEVAEYKPIIEFIENGGNPEELNTYEFGKFKEDYHLLVKTMIEELGLEGFYTGGADDLKVVEVDGPYMIEEYDGSESIRTPGDFW